MSGHDLDELADRVLDIVDGRAEAVVTVTHSTGGLTRFANSFIHQNVGDDLVTVALELTAGNRTAASSTSRVDSESLRRTVDATLAAASVRPVDPHWPGLCPPTPLRSEPTVHYDPVTAAAGPAERADVVAAFVDAGDGLQSAGYCETTATEQVLANSAGQRVTSRTTAAVVDGIQRAGRADGCASACSTRLADIDGATAGATAADRARRGTDPVELPPGRYEVILEARCVAYLLDFFSIYGFNARAVQEGRSFASVGELQLDPALAIWDDAGDPRHVGPAFDREGTPKRRLPLVDAGVVVAVTHDRRTATQAGGEAASTGHAIPGGESTGALARNVFLAAAAGAIPAGDLLGQVERGLLVSDFWYTRVLDPKTLVVTGLTRNGIFLVEDGQIGPAVGNLRFTQSPVAAFGPGQVLGVGDDGRLGPGGLHLGWNHAPTLHLAQWNFTGNASG